MAQSRTVVLACIIALATSACGRACHRSTTADAVPDPPTVEAPLPAPPTRRAPRPSRGCSLAAPTLKATETVSASGSDRVFHVAARPTSPADRPAPLLIAFHGSGGSGSSFAHWIESMRPGVLDAWMVYPDAVVRQIWGPEIATHWGQDADLPFVDAIVARILERACIDESRIFAFGWSSGGYFTNQLTCVRSERFAAVASLSSGPMHAKCPHPSPAILIHDRDDHSVVLSEGRHARATLQGALGCKSDAVTWPASPPLACRSYLGCAPDHPLVWCESQRQGHGVPASAVVAAFEFFRLF